MGVLQPCVDERDLKVSMLETKGVDLQATHFNVLNHDLVCENLFLIFFGLSAPL